MLFPEPVEVNSLQVQMLTILLRFMDYSCMTEAHTHDPTWHDHCILQVGMEDKHLQAMERIPVEIHQDAEDLSIAVAEEVAALIRERAAQGHPPIPEMFLGAAGAIRSKPGTPYFRGYDHFQALHW